MKREKQSVVGGGRRRLLDLLLLSAVLAAVLLPPVPGLIALPAAVFLWWLSCRPPARELIVIVGAGLAACLFLFPSAREAWTLEDEEAVRHDLEQRYDALLAEIETQGRTAAGRIGSMLLSASPRTREADVEDSTLRRLAFDWLGRIQADGPAETTLILVDQDGEAWAWSGPGLRNDLPEGLASEGMEVLTSFTAVSIMVIEPVTIDQPGLRSLRLVTGRSFGTDRLPFDLPPRLQETRLRWSIGDIAVSPAPGERLERSLLIAERGPAVAVGGLARALEETQSRSRWHRSAQLVLAFSLLVLAAQRGLARYLLERAPGAPAGVLALLALGLTATGLGASPILAMFASGALLVFLAALLAPVLVSWPVAALVATLESIGVVWLLALLRRFSDGDLSLSTGGLDLSATLFATADVALLRLGIWALAFSSVALLRSPRGSRDGPSPPPDLWALSGLVLCLASGAVLSWPLAASILGIASAPAFAIWWVRGPRSLSRHLTWAALAALLAATLWMPGYRIDLERWMVQEALPAMAPATENERAALRAEVEAYFAALDLTVLAVGDPDRTAERQDLALAIWADSPLERAGMLSAVVALPSDGGLSTFSFGLPLDTERGTLKADRNLPEWAEGPIAGVAPLRVGEYEWGEVRYWLEPRPGWRLAPPFVSVPLELLGGRAREDRVAADLPWGVGVAVYSPDGVLLAASRRRAGGYYGALAETPGEGTELSNPAVRTLIAQPRAAAEDPVDWRGARERVTGYIDLPGPLAGIESLLICATATLLLLACLGALLLLLGGLPRVDVRRELSTRLRSYSTRLILAFTVLLLVPIALLNTVLFRSLEERSAVVQREAGEAALQSARTILSDYITTLDPGQSIDSALDADVLAWVSQVAQHPVNIYWRGWVWASSELDLFTTGILPRRVPGEVFSNLALSGQRLSIRTQRLEVGREYLELYSPALTPREEPGEARLFLSVPLLALQEEGSVQLNAQRRRVVVVTIVLVLLLLVVGSRLAASFAQPLTAIVSGTDRIAAGATSLGLSPREPELAALVEAIDDMAARIAGGRAQLEQEKRVLEGVVENIAAGVVSFGQDARVIMHNEVARMMLGVAVGDTLADVTDQPSFEKVAALTDERARSRPFQTTIVLPGDEGEAREDREWTVSWVPVPGEGDPSALMVVEDVSEVLRSQRLEAWAEMARLIAHEIKNPLTPIRLSTEHLMRVWQTSPERLGEVFERCTGNILEQVEELYETASDFSTYSRIPKADPKVHDVVALVAELCDAYHGADHEAVAVEFESDVETLEVKIDRRLISRAVRNLIENAVRASAAPSPARPVEVHVALEGECVKIQVADRGPGVPPEHLERIFDPYFSTSSGGTGLGLPITRRVVEEHHGSVSAANRPGGGLVVTIKIPHV